MRKGFNTAALVFFLRRPASRILEHKKLNLSMELSHYNAVLNCPGSVIENITISILPIMIVPTYLLFLKTLNLDGVKG